MNTYISKVNYSIIAYWLKLVRRGRSRRQLLKIHFKYRTFFFWNVRIFTENWKKKRKLKNCYNLRKIKWLYQQNEIKYYFAFKKSRGREKLAFDCRNLHHFLHRQGEDDGINIIQPRLIIYFLEGGSSIDPINLIEPDPPK